MNTLYYGDNLKILRDYIKDESVDLIYLDPPFNSNRNYNVLFRNESGSDSESQITAFEDTWHWNLTAEQTYNELINEPDQVGRMIESFRGFIGTNQMLAYLVMMAVRLKELHRVLKPTGSLYLHCDPTASHYLKLLLDVIFGSDSFQNEIIWQKIRSSKGQTIGFGNVHDIIFAYRKSKDVLFHRQYVPLSHERLKQHYSQTEANTGRQYMLDNFTQEGQGEPRRFGDRIIPPPTGKHWIWTQEKIDLAMSEDRLVQTSEKMFRVKRYLDESKGNPLEDIWTDIPPINSQAQERLGYPTQKPVALLERIIQASSNEGDVVLDPFCGCGTTIAAAQKLNREWIGVDITHLSVGLMKLRLKDSFNMVPTKGGNPRGSKGAPVTDDSLEADLRTLPTGRVSASDAPVASYRVIGQPEDLDGAKELAEKDKYGFQWWVLPLIGAKAFGSEAGKKEGKKGADGGIDGMIVFTDDNSGKAKKVIVSVKGGHCNVSQIRDLGHVIDRENAAIGVFLTLEPPTKPMLTEAAEKGFYHSPGWNKDYPRLQILTVEDLLNGKTVDLPPNLQTYKQAGKVNTVNDDQNTFGFS